MRHERELVLISGLPGSGKSRLGATMAEQLQTSQRNVSHISLGDEVRRIGGSSVDSLHRLTIHDHLLSSERYNPLDDAITEHLAANALHRHIKSDLIILDGYPRSVDQYKDLGHIAINEGLRISGMLITRASDENMLTRLTGRNARPFDDTLTPEQAQHRIKLQQEPLSTLYDWINSSGNYHIPLRTIDTNGAKSLTTRLGLQAFSEMRQSD